MLHFLPFLLPDLFTTSTLSKITILAADINARMSTAPKLGTRSEGTLHGVHGLPALFPDGMPALASNVHERLAGPGDGLRANLPHWRGMATVGEVVVHLYFAHDIGLLLVALSDSVVLAIGLGEPEVNKFIEPAICL